MLSLSNGVSGLKRMDDGSLIKDYSEKEKETEQAIQMAVRQVAFEDERFLVSSSQEQMPIENNSKH